MMMRLAGSRSIFASMTRFLIPPEHSPTLRCWSSPRKLKRATYARLSITVEPKGSCSLPSVMLSKTEMSSSSTVRLWSRKRSCTVDPSSMEPSSAVSSPMMIFISVDLPMPLAPITPSLAWGGIEKVRPRKRVRSPYPLARFSTSSTLSPRRGPGGIRSSTFWTMSSARASLARSW